MRLNIAPEAQAEAVTQPQCGPVEEVVGVVPKVL